MRRLLLLAALVGAVCPEVFQTPLIRVATVEDAANNSRLRIASLGEHAQMMDNYRNARYLIEVEMGDPPQRLRVFPDTGSPNFWVLDPKACQVHDGGSHCSPRCELGSFVGGTQQPCKVPFQRNMSARFKFLPGRWGTTYGPKAQSSKFGGSIGRDRVQGSGGC